MGGSPASREFNDVRFGSVAGRATRRNAYRLVTEAIPAV
jgi:hypothetical protein